MRKSAFCMCEIKDADQLHVNHAADQRICLSKFDRFYTSRVMSKPVFCICEIKGADMLQNRAADQHFWFLLNRQYNHSPFQI